METGDHDGLGAGGVTPGGRVPEGRGELGTFTYPGTELEAFRVCVGAESIEWMLNQEAPATIAVARAQASR
ncbi:hypothetical protein Val02_14790 [Virgisporangium aliadipatigenens]|uniref:Uncharacterized protein n=1 Tax=Virgisporangium aliadipatigenens TaxID=741659 RepID=A0A8J4DPF5_9ACTN|nr:hypothetical protein Val02_14790 [Virgisporangium aliadipatigenens]